MKRKLEPWQLDTNTLGHLLAIHSGIDTFKRRVKILRQLEYSGYITEDLKATTDKGYWALKDHGMIEDNVIDLSSYRFKASHRGVI